MWIYRLLSLCMAGILALFVLAGCGAHAPVTKPAVDTQILEDKAQIESWRYVRFRLNWPEDEDPAWYWDTLIAHRIVAPVLERYDSQIQLWRFHRRAARDGGGHTFSFIFYSSVKSAAGIYADLQADDLLEKIVSAGVITKVGYDDLSRTTRPGIADTSDPSWPPVVKKTWPYFIMGASRMWLNIIVETADETADGKPPATIEEMRVFYSGVNDSINEVWKKNGRHAFLHHLNALFGYEPLIYYEKRLLKF